jgi:hypothetical protein
MKHDWLLRAAIARRVMDPPSSLLASPLEDAEERATLVACIRCGADLPQTRRRGARRLLCEACASVGWATTPCRACGGHTTRTDRTGPEPGMRNHCKRCRAEVAEWVLSDPTARGKGDAFGAARAALRDRSTASGAPHSRVSF